MNMPFIEEAVRFFEHLCIPGKGFTYSMTTNATLLDKYMDFLVAHDFALLISLDGDQENHSYRVNHAGENSFDRVVQNADLLRQK